MIYAITVTNSRGNKLEISIDAETMTEAIIKAEDLKPGYMVTNINEAMLYIFNILMEHPAGTTTIYEKVKARNEKDAMEKARQRRPKWYTLEIKNLGRTR